MMEERIIQIVNTLLPGIDVADSEDFFDDGLDSIGVMAIISMIESEFSIEISPADITADNFSNLSGIEEMLKKYDVK